MHSLTKDAWKTTYLCSLVDCCLECAQPEDSGCYKVKHLVSNKELEVCYALKQLETGFKIA
jgi:hypothetical protein